jgi:O-antigen/teichoic acid export membrane protein
VNEDFDRTEIRRRIVNGLAWESGTKLAMQLLGWGATIYVARRLGPDAYGVVAISGLFTILIQIFAEAGVTSGLVTRERLSDVEVRSTAWLNVYVALASYAVLWLAAPAIAIAYQLPVLTDVLRVAGLGVLVVAARAVPMALVLRRLDYRFRAMSELGGQAVQSVAMLVLAYLGYGVWTLVWSYLAGQALTTALFLAHAQRYGRPVFDFSPIRELLAFGARLTVSRTATYAIGVADMAVVSWVVGPRGAGLFMMAQTLASLPIDKVGALLNRVSFPAVARLQSDLAGIRSYFLSAHFWLVAICAPVAVGGALVAQDLVTLLFAERWRESGSILALLCVAAAFRLSGMMMPPVLEGLREARFLVKYSLLSAALLIPAFVLGSWLDGARGVAAAWATLAPVLWGLLVLYTLRKLGLGRREFAASVLPVFGALVGMAAVVWLVARRTAPEALYVRLAVEIAAGAVTYAGLLAWFTPRSRWAQARGAYATLRTRAPAPADAVPASPADPPGRTISPDADPLVRVDSADAVRTPDVPVAAERVAHRHQRAEQQS